MTSKTDYTSNVDYIAPPAPARRSASIEELFQRYGERYRWLAVATIGLGTFSVLLSSTIANVAIPPIMGAFGISQNDAQWLSTGYLASATISMLMCGWCLNRFGIQNMFLAPTALFVVSSLLAAASPNSDVLILARVLQGFAYGFFLPLATYLMTRVFPPHQQGLGMSLFGIMAVMGPAIGPYLGGIFVDALGWRSVFLLSLPMTALSVPMAILYLPGRDLKAEPVGRFDWQGLAWLTLAIVHLLVGLGNGQKYGWNSDFVVFCLTVTAITSAGFFYRQKRYNSPLLDLRLFRDRNYTMAALVSALYGAALFGGMFLIPLFLQQIQQLSATEAGLALLPAGLLLALAFPVSGQLSDRVPGHWLMIPGMLLLSYSIAVMSDANRFTGFVTICWWLVLGRIGMAMVMPALNRSAFSTLPDPLLTQASGTINFIRQVGGAFGVNLTSVYLDRRTSYHMDYITSTQTADNPQTQEIMAQWLPSLHQAGVEPALQEPMAVYLLSSELYQQANTLSYQDTFWMTGALMLLTLIPCYLLKPRRD